jgi:2-dehydropantoate 2-reductase
LRYLIFGSGAVGSYLGVQLALGGQEVSFLTREHSLNDLRRHGFTLSGDGPQKALLDPSLYTDAAAAITEVKPDLILLTVKAFDVVNAARSMAPHVAEGQVVVSFLNGINNEATLADLLGEDKIIPATLTTAVQAPKTGVIQVERVRGIGLAGDHPHTSRLMDELERSGVLVQRYAVPSHMKWSKLLTNIVSNATSAILGWTPPQVYAHPGLARIEIEALREAVRVMRGNGFLPHNLPRVPVGLLGRLVFLPTPLIRKTLGRVVGRGRGAKMPSFYYDIGRGRSEIEWLNGAVAKEGERLGIPTPVNKMLTETLLRLVHNQELHKEFLNQPQKLIQLRSN